MKGMEWSVDHSIKINQQELFFNKFIRLKIDEIINI